MKMDILKVENLVKTYKNGNTTINAVDHVSFSVEKGDFVAIVGASGSGKSTLLHLLGGVDRPTSGKVFIDNVDIYSMNNDALAIFRRRQVGLIYQFYNLIPILNVEENIVLPCKLDGKNVSKDRLNEIIDTLGLSTRRKHLANELSGGQQQRVAIARAIVNRPKVLIADEPTGNLDPETSKEIINVLMRINEEQGTTVLVVTHDQKIVQEHKKRTILMEDGCINADTSLGGYDL